MSASLQFVKAIIRIITIMMINITHL